jgi:hypothetical protein
MRQDFQVGGRAQVASLPVDDPLASDEKGVYFSFTRIRIEFGLTIR